MKHFSPSCRLHLHQLSGCLIHEDVPHGNVSQGIWKHVAHVHPLPATRVVRDEHAGSLAAPREEDRMFGAVSWSHGCSAWQCACEVCCAWIAQNCAKTKRDGIFPGSIPDSKCNFEI